jgi:hypothetical protein
MTKNAKVQCIQSLWRLLQVHSIDGHPKKTNLPNELGSFFKLIHACMLKGTKEIYGRSTIFSYQRQRGITPGIASQLM